MEHLQEVATILRKQLAEIEAKIAELTPKPKPVVLETMTIDEMRQKVANMYKTKAWRTFVLTSYGVVDNIVDLLDECYDHFVEYIRDEMPEKSYISIIGAHHSKTWQIFQLKVIKKLISPKNMDDDFSDTAGGCDEITCNAGWDVINSYK
jgi:hypothetical protein